MRAEKKLWAEEVATYLDKSDYVFLTDFAYLTVAEAEQLRARLAKSKAEFHVVKNSIFGNAAKSRSLPCLSDFLKGQTAVVVGGDSVPEVAKVLVDFKKEKQKLNFKVGVLEGSLLDERAFKLLSSLPSLEVLRGGFLALLQRVPAVLLSTFTASARDFVSVLRAKGDQA